MAYLKVTDVQGVLHDDEGIVNAAPAVQDVGQVVQRHVAILRGAEVQGAAQALHPVVVVADDSPVQPSQVVQHPLGSHVLSDRPRSSPLTFPSLFVFPAQTQ